MDVRIYAAYGGRVANTVPMVRTGYAGAVGEIDLPWYLLGLRFYVSWLRRFLSPDSASPFNAGGVNRYAYCSGDPINRIDPSGNASFAWLGRLLGRLTGAVGNAASVVSQVMPTTALTRIAAVVDVVAVGTMIGAVAAGALGDESTAGILGWVAAGSVMGRAGLGVAGQATSKSTYRSGSTARPKDRAGDAVARPGKSVHVFGGGAFSITAYAGHAPEGVNDVMRHLPAERNVQVPGMSVRVRRVAPRWYEIENGAGGVNYAVDSRVNVAEVNALFENVISKADTSLPIVVLSGAHGNPHGVNWSGGRRSNAFSGLYEEDVASQGRWAHLANRPVSDIKVVDMGSMSSSEYREIIQSKAHIVHAPCFGAADRKFMKAFAPKLSSITTYNLIPAWEEPPWARV